MIHLQILPPSQRKLWDELGATPRRFVLYGGTALALRLGHRQSEDFDFFSNAPFIPSQLAGEIAYLKGAETLQSSENTLVCLVDRGDPIKVSFFGDLGIKRVGTPDWLQPPDVQVAALSDLAATKVKVILDRALAKDYLDIAAILDADITLGEALGYACAVYGRCYNPLLSLKALCYFGEESLRHLPDAVKDRLVTVVRGVRVDAIPQYPSHDSLSIHQ